MEEAAPRIRELVTTRAGAFDSASLLREDGGAGAPVLPWDALKAALAELLRFLASALPALAAELREWASALARTARAALAAALPAAALVALAVLCCCCCSGYYAAGGRRRRRGPDGEEAYGGDGPVVKYGGRGGGGYKGGIFSMHPNKPIVC